MYAYQIKNLLKIGEFYYKGATNEFELAKAAKVHPFVAKKATSTLYQIPTGKLQKIYKNLQDIDYKVKTGKINIELALDIFVLNA